jgi:glycosyltransferase involved in cell wall biosynthesis
MKVLLVTEYFPPRVFGGGERSAELLAESLAANNIQTHVLTSSIEGEKEIAKIDGVTIIRTLKTGMTPYKFLDNVNRFRIFSSSVKREVRILHDREKYDVIHALNTTSALGISKLALDAKLFATINNYVGICPKGNLFYKEECVCDGCSPTKFISCMMQSSYVGKQKMNAFLKYNPLFHTYLYNDYLHRKKALRKFHLIAVSSFIGRLLDAQTILPNLTEINQKIIPYQIKKKRKTITYIGYIEKIKAVDLLIRSYAKSRVDADLLIVGDGSELANVKELTKRIGIEKDVIFTGRIDGKYIPYIYKISDAIALVSLWPEPFSRILLEATYYGKPILATNSGGNPDAVIDGKNGFLVNPKEEYISTKLRLLMDQKRIFNFGKQSRIIYDERFSRDKILKRLISLYAK